MSALSAIGFEPAGLGAGDLETLDRSADLVAEAWSGLRTARHEKRPPDRETVAMLIEAASIAIRLCDRHGEDAAALVALEAWQGRPAC